jgi:two-component system response regulator DevR
MAPFVPHDTEIQWDLSKSVDIINGFSGVFGTGSTYEAYLFVSLFKRLGAGDVLGAGCTEKEVEDLVDSASSTVILFLVDSIAKDCGLGLVRRLKARKPDLRAMLLVTSQELYARIPAAREVFDGIVARGSVGLGGLTSCIEALTRGEFYLDSLLKGIEGQSDSCAWNDLNQREREILPLLAKGKKNREIAAELFIAETTTRDYVSSILSKLQVSNRAAAAAWAIEHGFIGA